MCASSPVYPVIIGNVRGAQRMFPDPDWRAEDQREVQARTSGGKKDKDIDDDQGGDIYSFERVGKPIIRENCMGEFFMKNGLLYQETKTGQCFNQLVIPRGFDNR